MHAVAGIGGTIPTVVEYIDRVKQLETMVDEVYRYLNFHDIPEYKEVSDKVIPIFAAE